MIKLALGGASGRMCRTVYKSLIGSKDFEIIFGVDKFGGEDLPYPVYETFGKVPAELKPDVIVDFSAAAALGDTLCYALSHNVALVSATTGHSAEQMEQIKAASEKIAVFKASNMSLGINLLGSLSKDAMKFLGDSYDVEIVETHHNLKLDAPSGTALTLAAEINEIRNNTLTPTFGRRETAHRREKNEIGIHAVRGGSVVGKHDVMFFGQGEVIMLSHEAESKEVFVRGALRAAAYIRDKKSGYYDMHSILGSYYPVTSVNSEEKVSLVNIYSITPDGFLALLNSIKAKNINLDMISQNFTSHDSLAVSFTLSDDDLEKAETLIPQGVEYKAVTNKVKLTTEGAGMEHKSGVLLEVLSIMRNAGAVVHAITTSETKISCCIDHKNLDEVKKALRAFYGI